MRRPVSAIILIILASMFAVSCGGGGSDPNAPIVSNLLKRAFVSNQFAGALDIVDAGTDTMNVHRVILDPGPTVMSMSPDKKTVLVFTGSSNRLDVVSTAQEIQAGALQLQDKSESFFYLGDNKTVYAAVRNVSQVIKWDTVAGSTIGISVPNVRWIVRSNDSHYVLAFPDDNSNKAYVIDTTATTPVAVQIPVAFNRPVWAVFSSDDTKAYVMNCGPECGGTGSASVQIINLPALTAGAAQAVPGATHGLLTGNTLYVAGTPPATACVGNTNQPTCGSLSKLDVSAGLGAPTSYEINNGYHDHMLLGPSNKLFIGAEFTCTVVQPNGNGCLTIFNTSSNTATIVGPCDSECGGLNDVSGMSAITGRSVVYVVEGGELHIYDTATDALQARQVDTIGRSWDVVSPD